jgi:hypothetical protein
MVLSSTSLIVYLKMIFILQSKLPIDDFTIKSNPTQFTPYYHWQIKAI